jgi:hypothetical protein
MFHLVLQFGHCIECRSALCCHDKCRGAHTWTDLYSELSFKSARTGAMSFTINVLNLTKLNVIHHFRLCGQSIYIYVPVNPPFLARNISENNYILYFIEYSAQFFTLKMMLKYSLAPYTWKVTEKEFKGLFTRPISRRDFALS